MLIPSRVYTLRSQHFHSFFFPIQGNGSPRKTCRFLLNLHSDELSGLGFRSKKQRNNAVSGTQIQNGISLFYRSLCKGTEQYRIYSITKGFRILYNTVALTLQIIYSFQSLLQIHFPARLEL